MKDQINQLTVWAETNEADGLPVLVLPSGEVTISESASNLFKYIAETRKLFVRGGVVMSLSRDKVSGGLVLKFLSPDEARSGFEKHAKLMAWRTGEGNAQVLKTALCSRDMALAMLESEEAKTILPWVRGLINCPILRKVNDQLSVAGVGYDETTQLLVTGGDEPDTVELAEAVNALLGLLREFDFQTNGDKSRAVASLISPALAMGGFLPKRTPADVAEADQSQSGKTYRQLVTAAVYNERVSLIPPRKGGVGSVDESFDQMLVEGRPFILFDNFRGRFDSARLEAFLTAEGAFACRIPHRGAITVPPESYFVFLSSNGVDTTRDFANRSNIIRIRKKPAGHQFQQYEEGDLLAHVRQRQSYYLGCVFAVIREWHAQGEPRTNDARHDFRGWLQVVDWIVQHIFKLAPVMDGHQQAQESVSNPALVWLRSVVLAVNEAGELGKDLIATDLFDLCQSAAIIVPGLPDKATEDTGKKVIGSIMGKLFRHGDKLDVDGFTVTRQEQLVPRSNTSAGGHYKSKTYTITRP